MSEHMSAPPPIPSLASKPTRKWRWLKAAVGIIAAGLLAFGIFGSYNPINLELVRRDLFDAQHDGKVLEITNTGSKPVKLVRIVINGRADCNIYRLDAILGNNKPLFPSTLNVGDQLSIAGSCRIVRATVETDIGSNNYSFNR